MKEKFTYALAGNPNCGKTTLFNALTGSNQYVGNWPGVTVEKKSGRLKSHGNDIAVVDLPGIYSLSPYSAEEMVARNFLIDDKPDVIIDVVDATNLERNLYLTLQLAELGRPMVIALNMMDMLHSRGIGIDVHQLEHQLGIPVVPVSASKGQGLRELIDRAWHEGALRTAGEPSVYDEKRLDEEVSAATGGNPYIRHQLHDRREHHGGEYLSTYIIDEIYPPEMLEAVLRIEDIIEPKAMKKGMALRWSAIKLIDDDAPTIEKLRLSDGEARLLDEIVEELQAYFGERDMIVADQKYKFIGRVCEKCVTRLKAPGELTASDKIDKLVTHKYLAIPLFAAVMALVFFVTFGPLGGWMTNGLNHLIRDVINPAVACGLTSLGASGWAVSLVCGGVIAGVGSIVSFFPQILLLFFFLSLLEDSGYMARAAFIMDRMLHRTGLSGRSFVPMLMGFGCSVPGIMAARTLDNDRDRRMTIMLTPFMSCSAKMPVYALFIAAFFPGNKGLIVFGLYVTGLLVAILYALVLKRTVLKGGHAAFIMEMPPYRLPTVKTVGMHLYDRIKDFAVRAGTILLAASVIVWFLQSFSFGFQWLGPNAAGASMLAVIGKAVAPLLSPLGFGFWQAAVALIAGLVAKEAVVGTLTILYMPLMLQLQQAFTPASALSFMVFVLLYMPCVAAFSVMRREMKSFKRAAGAMAAQTGIAWVIAMAVYQIGNVVTQVIARV